MESGTLKLNQEFFDLHKTIENAFNIVRHQANAKDIELLGPKSEDRNYEVLQVLLGDERRYTQILVNFLSNAIKFSLLKSKVKVNFKVI